MTIRHKANGTIQLIPDPGAVLCFHCPMHPGTCDLYHHVPQYARKLTQEPDCLIDYIFWKLRYIGPARALRMGDEAAAATLARGLPVKWFYRRIEILADRLNFMYHLKKERHNEHKAA